MVESNDSLFVQAKAWILLPFYMFIVIKKLLRRVDFLLKIYPILIIITIFLTAISILIIIPLILLFLLFKKIVEILIKCQVPEFHSMMDSSDAFWCLNDRSRSIITVLLIAESNRSIDEIKKAFCSCFLKAWKTHYKIHCSTAKKFGYYYWKKQDSINVNNFVEIFDDYTNLDDYKSFMEKTFDAPMPLEDTATFQMIIGAKEINWKPVKQDSVKHYPILVRFHHSMGDGASVVSFMLSQFTENGVECLENYLEEFNFNLNKKYILTNMKTNFYASLFGALKTMFNADLKFTPGGVHNFDHSFLPRVKLGPKKHCTYFSDSNQEYSNKIKAIRNRYDLSFTKLLLTLVQESFGNLYQDKKMIQTPAATIMLSCMTAILKSFKLKDNVSYTEEGHPVVSLDNSFSMGVFNIGIKNTIPSNVDSKEFSEQLLVKLNQFGLEMDKLNSSIDYQFIHWMINFAFASVPANMLSKLISIHNTTLGITSLPGLSEKISLHSNKDVVLSDLLYWMPQFKTAGLGLMMTTYAGDFKLTLVSNSAYIPKKEDADLFISNILRYIDILYENIK